MAFLSHRILGFLLIAGGLLLAYAAWQSAVQGQPMLPALSPVEEGTSVAQAAGPAAKKPAPEAPARLRIATIGVNAEVVQVGVNNAGRIGSPGSFQAVGWYTGSPAPGKAGVAIIDGHLDNGLGLAGVFHNLDELKAGQEIVVEQHDGKILQFVVTERASYAYDEKVPALFAPSDTPRLVLITCEGDWLPAEKTYGKRLAVFAVLRD